MKTPEEIKKGLECCMNDSFLCKEECPYFNSLSNGVDCSVEKNADALAYIQKLEEQNAELVRENDKLQSSMGQVQKALQGYGFGSLEELFQAYNQAKRERDQKGYEDGREAGHEWISVEDRLPERAGMAVLVVAENTFGQKHVVKAFTDYTGRNGFLTNEKEYDLIWDTAWKVNHWMPLPEPPEEV